MPNRTQTFSTSTLTNAAESAANTETVVCTLSGISTEFDLMVIKFTGWLKANITATTTSGLIRVRRDSLTGTVVSEATVENQNFAASKTCEATVECDDTPRTLAAATYVLTHVGAGETGAATYLACRLRAIIN